MSKERELLRKVVLLRTCDALIPEIEALLAQPEPFKPDWVSYRQGVEDSKRETLTGREISQGFRADKDANNAESYWAGVALAEKHYGLTDYIDTYIAKVGLDE